VEELAVGAHGPDRRSCELDGLSVWRKAKQPVVSAANAPARGYATPVGALKALDCLELEI
jgi:hypothetical protein